MKYDHIGTELLKIAAFLYAARYIAAAVFMGPGLSNWNADLFKSSYQYVGSELTTWAIISAIAGVVLIIVALIGQRTGKGGA